MWVIKNKKYGNYYHSSINNTIKHFVTYVGEAKRMDKRTASKILINFNCPNNYELVKVGKYV